MRGEADKKSLDRWHRREVERVLAAELNRTLEAKRMAEVQAKAEWMSVSHGALTPDSNLLVKHACVAIEKASGEYGQALARWKGFVLWGVVPEDLGE